MSRYASISSQRILALFTCVLGLSLPAAANAAARVSESYGKLPLHFEANQGQTHEDVRFLSRGPGYSLYLTAGEAVLVLSRPDPEEKQDGRSTPGRRAVPAQAMPAVLRMSIVGAAPAPLVSGLEKLPGKANYFIGKDQSKWRTNIPTYARVHYREVYPGIDLIYYGNQRQLEYDFVVAPGADPRKIVLGFKGADKLEIDAGGDLVLHATGGAIRQKKPVIYQEVDGVRQEIAGGYVRKGANRVGFKLAAYDASRPLIIDPVVLSYSTYLGGSGDERSSKIAVDADGNAYVTGITVSANFPTTAGSFRTTHAGGANQPWDGFVTKLNPAGTALVYSTYLGGAYGTAIAADAVGSAYVTGSAGPDFPTTAGAFQTTIASASDAFVAKLNPAGSALVYSTYLGGSNWEGGFGIAVDAAGNVYVTGSSMSADFPTTLGAFQPFFGGGGSDEHGKSPEDAFVTKLNPTATGLIYSTYLGGRGDDYGRAIAVDANGNAYVTGLTKAINFPTQAAFQPVFGGGADAFVTKLHATGSLLVHSTYLGGSGYEIGYGIAIDVDGNAYVSGATSSTNFPTTPVAFQPISGGGTTAFVTKLDPAGLRLIYSTYLGGAGSEIAFGVAVDADGNAYVTGITGGDFPTTPGVFQPNIAGPIWTDAFVTKLNPTGSGLVYSTYLGGTEADQGTGIALDAAGNAYVTGITSSTDFPTTAGAFQPIFGGGQFPGDGDAFVAKISDAPPPPAPYSGTPFYGTAFAVPGSLEAEDFDLGGEGVAYHDNLPGNAGGQYRTSEDVDIIASSDPEGGGYVVNNFETGEWLAYTINAAGSTQYDIELRVSSAFTNSAFHVEIDGVDATGRITVPNTGSWSSFRWVGKKGVSLTAGTHVLKIVTDQQYFNLNSVRVLPRTTTRSEESAATYMGYWPSYGAETGTFSGGTIVASNQTAATATFTFTGTAVSWIGVKCNVCGIATVSIDGGVPTTVNTFGPGVPGSLTSEPVFSATGLAPDVTHILVITVTGAGEAVPGFLTGSAHVAVDAFDVTR